MSYSVSHVLVLISLIAQAHPTPVERLDCVVFYESSYRVEAVAQQAIGYLQGSTSKMTTSPETAQRALTYLEAAMASGQTRCRQLQRQVIEVTEYPYGREAEKVMA